MSPGYPWEARREGEATSEYLARALESQNVSPGLIERARLKHYDDYECPDHLEAERNHHRLLRDLRQWAERSGSPNAPARCRVLEHAVITGEFTGTKEEASAWAESRASLAWGVGAPQKRVGS